MAKRRRQIPSLAASDRPEALASSAHVGASASDMSMSSWTPFAGSADADLLPDLDRLVPRSRDMMRNNGLAAGVQQTLKDNIVGHILRLSTMPDYRLLGWTKERAREWGNQVEAEFRSWADTTECDAARELNLLGLTLQALGGANMNGDALALPLWLPKPGEKWATRMMMVEADRLATPPELSARDDIRGGIERDFYGAPVAYYVLKRHPGDIYASNGFFSSGLAAWDRIPATTAWGRRRVIHLHDKERTGQSRGKPLVTAVMREFNMAGKYSTTELEAAVNNSLIAAFLESDLDQDSAAALFGDSPDTVRKEWGTSVKQAQSVRNMKGAAIIPLPAGAKLSPFTPGRPNQAFEAFMLATLRHIAAGLNLPYELLVKDFSKTNYSSARAALLEAWRYFHGRRRWLMDAWLRPIYELWLEEAVNAGRVEAPDFYAKRYAYCRAKFIFGGRGWVDPVKEAQASVLRMQAGLSTLEAECAEQGLDYEEVLDQQAVEMRMKAERGLPAANLSIAKPSGKSPVKDDEAADEDDEDGRQSTAAYHDTLAMLAGQHEVTA
jgi:lambda family phage portal protein